ncbi:MAG: hypothetical protein ABFD97_06580 [Syntrophobacter sp.]
MQQKRCVAFESHVTRKYRIRILRSQSANQLEKAHLPEVDANFQQVQQGFINIMDNARYAFADTSASRVPNRLPGIDCLTLYRKIKRVYIAPPPMTRQAAAKDEIPHGWKVQGVSRESALA